MDHYDVIVIVIVIVIGSGPGGASLVHRLAPTGKRILLLERGDYLPRSSDNWKVQIVFVDAAYQAKETWFDGDGNSFHPGLHYFVGGNSKVYGAALFRLRARDFGEIRLKDGLSPAWPLTYEDFEPYYTDAEELLHVHGARAEDPTEPPASRPYLFPPVSHEPRIRELSEKLARAGLHRFHMPLGVLLDEKDGKATPTSAWFGNNAFDGFPCLLNGKADAQVMCVDPVLAKYRNVILLTNAFASKLDTDPSGRSVSAVEVVRNGSEERYSGDIGVVACGALSSALLLLRSASAAHPTRLANGSDQVGRNYLRHNQSVLMALSRKPNDTVFQKTLALSDYYFGAPDWEYPLGLIQIMGKSHPDQIRAEALPEWLDWVPDMPFEMVARHSVDFWPPQGQARRHPQRRRRAPASARAQALPGQGHSGRRHGTLGRHRSFRNRSGHFGAGYRFGRMGRRMARESGAEIDRAAVRALVGRSDGRYAVGMGPGEASLGEDQRCTRDDRGRLGHRSATVGDEPAVFLVVQCHVAATGKPCHVK